MTVTSGAVDLRGLTLAELEEIVQGWGLPRYRARQIFAWVHGRGVTSTVEMTDLSRSLRRLVAEHVALEPAALVAEQTAADGTCKLGLRLEGDHTIETVLIPDGEKLTQCLSTQVGCGLACRFCATGTMGLVRNLGVAEIVEQVYRARARLAQGQRISNLVFMGMGEPMNNLEAVLQAIDILCTDIGANFSARRMTVSTAGVVPGIERLGQRNRHVGLAVSLNATTDEVRDRLMPVNRRWPLPQLMEALRGYPLPRRRRITFEYVLIAGVNDTTADARRLVRLLAGIRAKVNLIAYNPAARLDPSFRRPDTATIEAFADRLRDKDLSTFVRQSRGQEIAAACGQLVSAVSGAPAADGDATDEAAGPSPARPSR